MNGKGDDCLPVCQSFHQKWTGKVHCPVNAPGAGGAGAGGLSVQVKINAGQTEREAKREREREREREAKRGILSDGAR